MTSQVLMHGDCLDVFRDIRGLGAIVTDPPAGIGFMGRGWDKDRGGREKWIAYWAERFAVALNACEENAVGLFWALPRTSHWTACAVEDAGWKIRDVITHHFGQGWPKDKSALKPSTEFWILAVKGKPVLGIDACKVDRCGEDTSRDTGTNQFFKDKGRMVAGGDPRGSWPTNLVLSHAETCSGVLCAVGCDCGTSWLAEAGGAAPRCACEREAWRACPVAEMDRQGVERGVHSAGARTDRGSLNDTAPNGYGGGMVARSFRHGDTENGSACSRFFPRFGYYAKAPSGERHAGCGELLWRVDKRDTFGFVIASREEWEALDPKDRADGNVHPTVKRLSLMRWLHRLTGAKKIGDLCGGSGSGAVAAYLDGIEWIGAEVSPQAIEIAEARLAFWRGLSPEARAAFTDDKPFSTVRKIDERAKVKT